MIFKKDKEYLLINKDKEIFRLICTKVVKDTKGEITEILFTNPVLEKSSYSFTLESLKDFIIEDPVDNTEFFIMYTNWNNFYKLGFHQDLEYAEKTYKSILDTLKKRTHVKYGTGAFIDYDYRLMNKLLEAYST